MGRQSALVVRSVLATLLVIELLLRVFDPLGMRYFPEADRYFRNTQPNDAFGYIHRAGYRGRFEGVDVSINSHGFRGPEHPLAKPAGVSRLLILGDSVVFGWGAPQDSIFPARLERRFKSEGKQYEVIPAGVGSWNTRTEYEYLRERGLEFEPDVVLVVATNNDIVPNLGGRTDIDKDLLSHDRARGTVVGRFLARGWRVVAKRSYLLMHIQYFPKRRSEAKAYSETTNDSPTWQDARLALDGIIDLCGDRGIPLVFCLYTSEPKLKRDTVLELYKVVLDSRGVPVVMVADALFHDKAYRNSFVDGHANSRGQALIAESVYTALAPILGRAKD